MKKFHTMDFNKVRESMIEYHKEEQQRWAELADHAERKRDKREYRAKAEVHEGMVQFWTDTELRGANEERGLTPPQN